MLLDPGLLIRRAVILLLKPSHGPQVVTSCLILVLHVKTPCPSFCTTIFMLYLPLHISNFTDLPASAPILTNPCDEENDASVFISSQPLYLSFGFCLLPCQKPCSDDHPTLSVSSNSTFFDFSAGFFPTHLLTYILPQR